MGRSRWRRSRYRSSRTRSRRGRPGAARLTGSRKDEFEDLNHPYGLTTHAAFHEPLPDGNHLAVVVLDGPGADSFLEKLATSDNSTDVWFRSTVEDVHPMDFSNPPPAPMRMI